MGLYDTKIDQLGNIDAAYNNYHVRQLVYDDDCFNNTCGETVGNCSLIL